MNYQSVSPKISKYSTIAFDTEGHDLSRIGALTVACFLGYDPNETPQDQISYVVDVQELGGKRAFEHSHEGKNLKSILESSTIRKLMFDVRADSDALYHQYGVRLRCVLDLQVYEQACKLQTGWRPYDQRSRWLRGMKNVVPVYLEYEIKRALLRASPPHKERDDAWIIRPMTENMCMYAAADTYSILYLFECFESRNIATTMMTKVEVFSEQRIDEFRSLPYALLWSQATKNKFINERSLLS